MKIREGYNGQHLGIRLQVEPHSKMAQVWVEQPGLPEEVEKYQQTLSYASLEEVIALRDECNDTIRKMTGL